MFSSLNETGHKKNPTQLSIVNKTTLNMIALNTILRVCIVRLVKNIKTKANKRKFLMMGEGLIMITKMQIILSHLCVYKPFQILCFCNNTR